MATQKMNKKGSTGEPKKKNPTIDHLLPTNTLQMKSPNALVTEGGLISTGGLYSTSNVRDNDVYHNL